MDRFRDVDGRRQIAATSGGIIDEISRSASAQEGNVRGEAEYGMASAGQHTKRRTRLGRREHDRGSFSVA